MNDILIVGGGLAGLAAATLCGRAGLRTKLVERADSLGGRAQTDLEAGHAFNQGGHALYIGGAGARILRELGIVPGGKRPPTEGQSAIARGAIHALPSGLVSLLRTDLLTFGGKVQTARALATIARMSAKDTESLRDVSWATWLGFQASRPEVRDVLCAVARVATYSNAPRRASAGAILAQIKIALDPGVLYVDDGWQSLVSQLEEAARNAGVVIETGRGVAELARAGASFSAISREGSHTTASVVVLAVGPGTARKLLGVPALAADAVAVKAACLDLGLSALPCPARIFALGTDAPTYFSVHSATARLAERGATVHVMKYLDPDAPADPSSDLRELEAVLDLLQPGWRDRVVAKRFLPGLVATNALVAAGSRRPEVDAAQIAGAFVAGDWVGKEGMLADAALSSAKTAAEQAIAHARRVPRRDAREGSLVTS